MKIQVVGVCVGLVFTFVAGLLVGSSNDYQQLWAKEIKRSEDLTVKTVQWDDKTVAFRISGATDGVHDSGGATYLEYVNHEAIRWVEENRTGQKFTYHPLMTGAGTRESPHTAMIVLKFVE